MLALSVSLEAAEDLSSIHRRFRKKVCACSLNIQRGPPIRELARAFRWRSRSSRTCPRLLARWTVLVRFEQLFLSTIGPRLALVLTSGRNSEHKWSLAQTGMLAPNWLCLGGNSGRFRSSLVSLPCKLSSHIYPMVKFASSGLLWAGCLSRCRGVVRAALRAREWGRRCACLRTGWW